MTHKVLFSRKKSKAIHPSLIFNGKDVSRSKSHKHLSLVFDSKLSLDMHLKGKFSIINNSIENTRHSIPRQTLLSIYNTFLRPLLDSCGVIYDNPDNEKFTDTVELIKYYAALAIIGAITGKII